MTQGNILGRYSILHELGRGAAGAVYAARVRATGAVVALKRLDPALLNESDRNVTERVLKHARSARHLKHRNIVNFDDAGEAGGTVYVAMEMLEGANLRKILDDGPLPITRAIQIAHDIAYGLAYAHLEGVVHGRLKPSNIMLLRSGAVKITDFGIGQLGRAALVSGARAGCLRYLSPEQVRGDAVDHRCDLFSLGALLYEMLAHRPPFEGDSPKEITESILHAVPRPPSELNEHVPRALDAIVMSMLARQPVDRMPGVPILLRELERLEEGLGLRSGTSTAEATAGVPPAPAEPGLEMPDPTETFQHTDQVIDREGFDYHRARMQRESAPGRISRLWPAMFAALALVLAVLGVGLTGFMDLSPGRSERVIVASPVKEVPARDPVASLPTVPPPVVAEATKEALTAPDAPQASPPRIVGEEPKPLAKEPGPSAQPVSSVARAPEQPASASAAPAQELPRAVQATAEAPEPQRDGTARIIVAVSPRGEIYIDGEHRGTTPPITTFDLKPGMHRIEVRSGSRTPYLTYMTVQAGDVRRIRHDFDAKSSRPPS